MLNDKLINNFIVALCEIYTNKHGSSQSGLAEFKFGYTICDEHQNLIEIIKKHFPDERFGDGLSLVFNELVERQLLERTQFSNYSITKKGYALGTSSTVTKVLNFFNINPGINTFIAILSLIIACFALYVSFTRP